MSSIANSLDELQKHIPPISDVEQPPVEDEKTETNTSTTAPEPISPFHPSQFPDGGKDAYLCLLGSFCCLFCSFGWLNCLGVFQNYYQKNQLRDYSPSTVAWIPSIEVFMMFFPGPIVGWAFDNHGPKYILIFGTFFHVFGLMMTSLCSEYYQFILAQSICSALGLNCIFNAGTSSLTTWFLKKRGLALGIMAAGSGLGGIIIPIMASHLIPEIGFAWAMRTIAFMLFALLVTATLTVTSRVPTSPRPLRLKVIFEPFTDSRFVVLTISSFTFFMGMFIPINFIEIQAIANGMSTRLAGYIVPILNVGSVFGRVIPGILADKYGKFNIQALCCTVAGILVLALGLPASGNAAYIAYAASYGFASGAYVSLYPAQTAQISEVHQIGVRIGVASACISFGGLAGNPIAGAIVTRDNGKYWGLNVFAGVLLTTGAAMFIFTRFYVANWKVAAKI